MSAAVTITIVFPFPEVFRCPICYEIKRGVIRSAGVFKSHSDLIKHAKKSHPGYTLEHRCGVCGIAGKGAYPLKNIKGHHATAHTGARAGLSSSPGATSRSGTGTTVPSAVVPSPPGRRGNILAPARSSTGGSPAGPTTTTPSPAPPTGATTTATAATTRTTKVRIPNATSSTLPKERRAVPAAVIAPTPAKRPSSAALRKTPARGDPKPSPPKVQTRTESGPSSRNRRSPSGPVEVGPTTSRLTRRTVLPTKETRGTVGRPKHRAATPSPAAVEKTLTPTTGEGLMSPGQRRTAAHTTYAAVTAGAVPPMQTPAEVPTRRQGLGPFTRAASLPPEPSEVLYSPTEGTARPPPPVLHTICEDTRVPQPASPGTPSFPVSLTTATITTTISGGPIMSPLVEAGAWTSGAATTTSRASPRLPPTEETAVDTIAGAAQRELPAAAPPTAEARSSASSPGKGPRRSPNHRHPRGPRPQQEESPTEEGEPRTPLPALRSRLYARSTRASGDDATPGLLLSAQRPRSEGPGMRWCTCRCSCGGLRTDDRAPHTQAVYPANGQPRYTGRRERHAGDGLGRGARLAARRRRLWTEP